MCDALHVLGLDAFLASGAEENFQALVLETHDHTKIVPCTSTFITIVYSPSMHPVKVGRRQDEKTRLASQIIVLQYFSLLDLYRELLHKRSVAKESNRQHMALAWCRTWCEMVLNRVDYVRGASVYVNKAAARWLCIGN
jgi:hypothetical protein